MHTYVERPPLPELADHVSSVWVQRVAPGGPPHAHRSVASGGVELLCAVGELPRVVGPHTVPLVEMLAPGTTVVGLRFHPGGAPSALGLPASELVDLTVEAGDLWGRSVVAVGEAVAGADSPERALLALQRYVASRIAAGPDPLVREAVRRLRWRTDDVTQLSSALHISERQLRRRTQAETGLAPKTLHRILRFQGFLALAQHAVAHGRAPTDEGLARLAAEAGYADQPHLSRESQRLSGASPGAFVAEIEHNCGSGHDHAASFAPVLRSRALAA